jgi:NADH-quinone oxidoreductase subunit L
MQSSTLLSLLVLLPFVGATIIFLFRVSIKNPQLLEQASRIITIVTPLILAFIALYFLTTVDSTHTIHSSIIQWIHIGDLNIHISLMLDALSIWMVLFISLISSMIFIYATGYMHNDDGFSRFFIYFHLFLGSMMLLVLGDNPIVMFVGWEGVGLCSYLLIGYYNKDKANLAAANKAFFLNRVGDFGFVAALSLLFISIGSTGMDYTSLEAHVSQIDPSTLNLIAIFFFIGAMGKSAQIPLYVWLPDAMAGPTPVSALIHAATMVTAGVYMVVRFSFIYTLVPDIGLFIAYIGAFSALIAALFAAYATDIKKILAYSTMSQLGYMFMAAGLEAYSAAMYHLFTHAFFKALLFMGAGAVIVALHHEQNIFKMGNLKNYLPIVFITMFIATVSISGIPPFSGFFSKDAIVAHAFFTENYGIWAIATATAFLTAYYMFRLFFTVFMAPSHQTRPHLEPVAISMQWPLVLLAIGAAINGLWNMPHFMGGESMVSNFLSLPEEPLHATAKSEWLLTLLNSMIALTGMYVAYKKFTKRSSEPNERTFISRILVNKLYIDEFYDLIIVRPIKAISQLLITYSEPFVAGIINKGVQGYHYLAIKVNALQSGDARSYLVYIMGGTIALSLYILFMLKAVL